MKDCRPISLLRSIYKIIAKVLTERLKVVLNKLVSGNENAFIKSIQIVAMVARECVDYYLKKGKGGVVCKLDLEKGL